MGQGPTCIWSQRPPQSRYKLQPYFSSIDEPSQQDGVGDFCTVDDDLGKHFFHDFYVAQLQYNVPTGDLCTIDFTCRYLHTFDYDLECHIRRYSSSKLRK